MRRHLLVALAAWAALAAAGAGPLLAPGTAQASTACGARCGAQHRACRAEMVRTGRYGSRCAHRLRACHERCLARSGRSVR